MCTPAARPPPCLRRSLRIRFRQHVSTNARVHIRCQRTHRIPSTGFRHAFLRRCSMGRPCFNHIHDGLLWATACCRSKGGQRNLVCVARLGTHIIICLAHHVPRTAHSPKSKKEPEMNFTTPVSARDMMTNRELTVRTNEVCDRLRIDQPV